MDPRTKLISSLIFYLVIVLSLLGLNKIESCDLSYDYYEKSCPQVEQIVRAALTSFFLADPTSPAALLRLMFHDCQVQGCDASILIDPVIENSPREMDSGKNFGIRKRELIGSIKTIVEAECPDQVSCSDLIVLAARDAVALSGGPDMGVPLGRKDAISTPSRELADALLPPATAGVDAMLSLFGGKGMSLEESVAIMGAHTLGITHCSNILTRLYTDETKEKIDPQFEKFLRRICPQKDQSLISSNSTFILNDPTSFVFDNIYYQNAISGRGALSVDAETAADQRTRSFMELFSGDQNRFFQAFSSAFVKLSCSGVVTGNKGIVRKRCNEIN